MVGSGKFAGYSLYFLSSDTTSGFACTATKVSCRARVHRLHESVGLPRKVAAITTIGAPVASGGVKASLLGSVTRPGIGDQVTYAGHPLYLFDMGASQITGEGFDEADLARGTGCGG